MSSTLDNAVVPCWETLRAHGAAVALIDANNGDELTYHALAEAIECFAEALPLRSRGVVLLFGEQDPGCLICALGCLQAGHAVYLLPIRVDHPGAGRLVEAYRPELLLWRNASPGPLRQYRSHDIPGDYRCVVRCGEPTVETAPHCDLALMLSTSASTGGAKSVCLSRSSLATNAAQIVRALRITPEDRAIAGLPFGYVYGLSVMTSHLLAGASVVISSRSAADPAFWGSIRERSVTTLPGVSLTYDFLRTRDIGLESLPRLHKLTHSGDRMSEANSDWLLRRCGQARADIFLMYGQTEASGRISVLPPELFSSRSRSVGLPVSGGSLRVDVDGQILYTGPNVMLGYARGRADLAAGDVTGGTLATGDLGYLDGEGLLYITGRIARRCKLFGRRVDLDDVESYFSEVCPAAVMPRSEGVTVFFTGQAELMQARLLAFCQAHRLPPQSILLRRIESLPRTASGKIAYSALRLD